MRAAEWFSGRTEASPAVAAGWGGADYFLVYSSGRVAGWLPCRGFMSVGRSGALGHGGRIWSLGFCFLTLLLLWSELGVEEKADASFNKFVASGHCSVLGARSARKLSPVGLGGEGRGANEYVGDCIQWWRVRYA